MKISARMILAERINLFVSKCKLTIGNSDLLSIITNSVNEMIPIDSKIMICMELVTSSVSKYDKAIRNEVIVAERAIIPFTSIDLVWISLVLLSFLNLLTELPMGFTSLES